MDRQIIYPGQIPLETDLLNTNKNVMIGMAKLAAAILGITTQVNGLACVPNSPAALNVIVNPGEIYSLQNIDGTAYSSLAADTTHTILKQGILLDAVTLAAPAPATAGQSINYLVQAAYLDSDSSPVVLPYYNASNPSQAYSGPANAGTTNNTIRKGLCNVTIKAGIAASTGSQTTPAPDAGYVGLYSVTVANGQTSIVAGNIAALSTAPIMSPAAQLKNFISSKTTNGYVQIPQPVGSPPLIIQWCTTNTDGSNNANFVFPIAFPNAILRDIPYAPGGVMNVAFNVTTSGLSYAAKNGAGSPLTATCGLIVIGY